MKRTMSILSFSVLLPVCAFAQSVQQYSGTVFVPGAGEDYTVWTRQHSSGQASFQAYDAAVVLGNWLFPQAIPTNSTVAAQASSLRAYLDTFQGASNILVAHSMGGLVSREVYRQNPAGIAGLVTIATPHYGSYTATNSQKFVSYLNATISRLAQTGIPLGVLHGSAAPLVGNVIGGVVGHFAGQRLQEYRDSVTKYIGVNQAVLNDVKVYGAAVSTLQVYSGDASLPRGSVHGSIPVTNFPIRLLSSLTDSPGSPAGLTYSQLVWSRNLLVALLRNCKVAYYVTIVFSPWGRRCSLAKKMITRMDGQFFAWATGQPSGGTQPRDFDGIVELSRAQYPFVNDANRKQTAFGSDHFSILFDVQGVQATTDIMRQINMTSR